MCNLFTSLSLFFRSSSPFPSTPNHLNPELPNAAFPPLRRTPHPLHPVVQFKVRPLTMHLWKLAVTASILSLTQLMAGDPCSISFPKDKYWSKYRHALNRLTKYGHLEKLLELNRATDIPVFISLLDCQEPVGREGDTTAELVFDHLKSAIPIEYECPKSSEFELNQSSRAKVMKIYQDWWVNNGSMIEFDTSLAMFFPRSKPTLERQALAKVHNSWYIKSH